VQLQWGTYYDAADQAGLSRIWGGIHPPVDDFTGRRVGSQCGLGAWALAQKYFDGSVTNTPSQLAMVAAASNQCNIVWTSYRGLYYKLQSTTNMLEPFADDPAGFVRATDSPMIRPDNAAGPCKFYRVISAPTP
jgi:hypothetical protein